MRNNRRLTGLICSYCRIDPGVNPKNPILWNGFFDKDTSDVICWNCYDRHYRKKINLSGLTTFTEFPIWIKQIEHYKEIVSNKI